MSETSDPSLVDTATLMASLERDLGQVNRLMWDAAGFLREGRATLAELNRRADLSGSVGEGVLTSQSCPVATRPSACAGPDNQHSDGGRKP